uniref:Type II secretion system protein J n=1 Tax=Candidatus Kentrum sp. LPFa TaxID=2126335 RepID=A0A450WEG4_9GAMM|nr:MAG: general secretion pathway protein J [Candidatus Kentron sp. LPFa]
MKNRQSNVKQRQSGMTLIELLIALTIFAIISAITYGAIRAATETQQRIEAQTTRFAALRKAIAVIGRDVSQMLGRPIRDEHGEPLPALKSSEGDFYLMEFTRTGWQTLAGVHRVRLRRIAYALENRRLLRFVWNVLDRAEDSLPSSSVLLTEVDAVEIRYLDTGNQWLSEWPLEWAGGGVSFDTQLPRAIEINLNIANIGRIRRLFALPE